MKKILAFILAFALIFPTTAVIACATTGEVVAVVNSELVSDEAFDENVSDEDVSDENVSDEDVSNEDNSGGSIFENVFNMDTITDLVETIMAALGNIDFGAILDALSGVVDMILSLLGLGGEEPTTPPEEPTTPPEEPTTPPTSEEPQPAPEQTPSVDNSDNDDASNSGNSNSGNTSNNNSSNNTNSNVQQSGGTPVEMPLVPMSAWTILVIVIMVIVGILVIVL